MTTTLHEYQNKMVQFAVDHPKCGWFVDMGLGKSLASLELIRRVRPKRTLVVAPRRVVDIVWPTENKKHGYNFRMGEYPSRNVDIELCSCDSVHKLVDSAGRWDMLILDESQKFKAARTRRFKSLKQVVKHIPRRVLLSGTPAPNSLVDLWSQMYLLDGGERLGKTLTYFRAKYCEQGGYMGREWRLRHGMESAIYGAVSDAVIRMDALDHLDMPELVTNDVVCHLPSFAAEQHRGMKRKLFLALETEGTITAPNAAAALMKCRQIANGFVYDKDRVPAITLHDEKISTIQELLDGLVGQQAIVVYQFKEDAAVLGRVLGAESCSLDGKNDAKTIEQWLTGRRRILCLQLQSGSHGLNLQGGGCGDMIFYGLSYSCENYQQMVARLYRQGAARQIRVHRVLAEDTVDGVIRDRLDGKIANQDEFLQVLKRWASN